MKKRIFSMLLVVCMVFTLFPTAAFAEEDNTSIGASNVIDSGKPTVCEKHTEHDGTCDYFAAVEGVDCIHQNEDGTYYCAPTDGVSENGATPSEAEYVCNHKDDCGYKKAVEGKDCTHTCELCSKESTPPSATDCDCDSGEKCVAADEGNGIKEAIKTDCPFCRVEGADLEQCTGKEAQKSFSLGVGAPNKSQKVYFGNTEGKDPALYRIVAQDDNTMTLFYNGENIATALKPYDSSGNHNSWSGSTICDWLNNDFLKNTDIFTAAEAEAITKYNSDGTTESGAYQTITVDQKIVLPSVTEVKDVGEGGTWEMGQGDRQTENNREWWLRSPGRIDGTAAVVRTDGSVAPGGYTVFVNYGVRPAFKLNLSSVLFASAATGGKSGAASATLSAAEPPTGNQKLTIVDDYDENTNSSGQRVTIGTTSQTGNTITIPYSDAITGEGQHISAVVKDDTGTMRYYGKIADTSTTAKASGEATVTVPQGFGSDWTLWVFSELIHDSDTSTDYASTPEKVEVKVGAENKPNGTVKMPWGQEFEVNKATKDATTKIMYGGETWLVIGSGDTGVATAKDDGTMTLFANNNIVDEVKFDNGLPNTNNYYTNGASLEQSNLKTVIDGLAETKTTANSGLFTAKEQSAIKPVTLTGGNNNIAQGGMFGDPVSDAKLWPLDVDEANALNGADIRGGSNYWWLRSPGNFDRGAAFVNDDGSVYPGGIDVDYDYGVRPAFKLNLSSVLFASAATGGKSGAASATLPPMVWSTGEQKLTILDNYVENTNPTGQQVKIVSTNQTDNTITINYSGATTGTGQHISAVVKDDTGTMRYYGKIADTSTTAKASGEATVTVPQDFGSDWTLWVFSELIHDSDTSTDYASTPEKVEVKVGAENKPNGTVPMPWGQEFAVNTDSKATTTKIMYGGKTWLVIGSGDTGVATATADGTMTLFANDIMVNDVKFDKTSPNTNNYYTNGASVEQSNLKTVIDGLAETKTTANSGLFTAKEQSAIKPVTLTGGNNNIAQGGMFGDPVSDAKLWPLDVDEANALNGADIRRGSNYWWLRSPGYDVDFAAVVNYYGSVTPGGGPVLGNYGVRPAFKLNLSSILFASAATGGKSGAASATLPPMVWSTGNQKLTIVDNYVENTNPTGQQVKIVSTNQTDNTITINYSGATTGTGQHISAVVKDDTGTMRYYGKIADTSTTAKASGEATVTVPQDFGSDWKLEVFSELIHDSDTSTDYASEPVTVTVSFTSQTNTVTPPTSNQTKEPTKTEIKLDTKVDSEEGAIINITNKNMTDAIEKAIADAKKNGKEADGISLVFRSDTGTNEVNKLTVQLPKTVQEMMINNKVASTVVVMDNLNIKIELDLKAMTKINQQAKTNVKLIVEKLDNKNLTGKAKTAIGNRPVFDFKVSYGNGKYVSSFGNGSVSISIPYTLISGEKAGNVYGVYVDSKNKVHWITNSSYDATAKVLRFNTNYCSTYGVGYIADGVTFNDITDHWAKSDIEFVLARGLLTNTSATTFEPNTAMTGSMFVTALGKLAGINTNSYKTGKFADVNGDADYAPYVNWAVSKGIITGTTPTTFSPNQTVTRQEMAVLLTNYAKAMGVTVLKSRTAMAFADSTSIQSGAQEAVKSMQMAGIIMGKEKNLFDPTGIATKAEVAAVLRRYVELGIDKVTAQGLDVNDSGQIVYYENGNLFTGTKTINDQTYYFGSDGICTKIDTI